MKLGIAAFIKLFLRYLIALALNLLKGFPERSKISFNKFRTSATRNGLILVLVNVSNVLYPFSYDSAIYAAQKGDIKGADEQLRTIVVNAPDSADVLYDAGEIAYQLNNFSQAAAYFTRAAECAHDDKNLCFRAHYNAGNAYVDTKNLPAALEQYDKALAIEPDNEYARHNRDRVAQMLQEQEKQQDQQNDKNKKDDQEDKQEDEQSGDQNDQQQNDGKNDQQQGDQQKQNQKNSESGDQSDQKSNGEQGDDSKQGDNGEQREQQGDAQKNQQNSANNKKRNGEQGLDEKSKGAQDKGDKQEGKQHENTPGKQDGTQDKNNVTSAGDQEQGKSTADTTAEEQDEEQGFGKKIDDPWLMNILNDQELKDKAINKQLMEAKVRQHGGKNGQNCW